MGEPTTYRIEIRGNPGERMLAPFLDDFTIRRDVQRTCLVGPVTDAAHLHGLIVHLTALNAEVLSVNATDQPRSTPK